MPYNIKVPLAAVQVDDGTGVMVAPEKGDMVSVTVEADVTDIKDGVVTIYVKTANGQPIEADGEAEDAAGDMAEDKAEKPEGAPGRDEMLAMLKDREQMM